MAFYRPTSVRDYLELGRKVLRLRWTLVAVFVAIVNVLVINPFIIISTIIICIDTISS